jgi:5-methylcytosine-specific restriction protein A
MAKKPNKVNRSWVQPRVAFERERRDEDFDYNGRRWRKVRLQQLDEFPICCDCEAEGVITIATVADHEPRAKELIARGDDPYDRQWLMSRCKKHHDSKSGRERHYK